MAQFNSTYTFRHIEQTDGLLHTTVRGIGQDRNGFIWILTLNGVQRYDGSRFVNYPELLNQSSFGVMNVSELNVDTSRNEVSVIKKDSIIRLALSNNQMTTLSLEKALKEERNNEPFLFTDDNQNRWLIGENGVIQYEKDSKKILNSFFNINPEQDHRNNYVIRDPSSGDFWTHDFFYFILADVRTKKIQKSSNVHADHPLLKQLWNLYGHTNRIRYIMLDSDQNLWISTWTPFLHRYNLNTKKLITYSLKDVRNKEGGNAKGDVPLLINALYEDRQKNIWLATDYAGLLLYDREKDDFNFITSDESISNGLRYNYSILSIFQDRDDNIWLGTDRGISIFNPYRNHFQSIHHLDGKETSMPKYNINDMIETSQGEILIATWGGGISIYDPQWNFKRNIVFKHPNELNLVWCFVQNDDGTIWVGAQHGYIHIYDPVKQSFRTIQPEATEYSTIRTMTKDHEGNILLGLQNGHVAVWNKRENIFYPYNMAVNSLSLPLLNVVNIYVDQSNRCWVATALGLQLFDIQKRVYTKLYQPHGIDPATGITMEGIEEFNDSILLIGSIYKGLYFFNMNTKEFSRPFIDTSLNNTSVYAIRKDGSGNIWITTNYSILKTNASLTAYTRFGMDQSIINDAFGSSRFYVLSDGRWVTSTPAELVCFDPGEISTGYTENRAVGISEFKVFDHPLYIDSFLDHHRPVILPFNKNFITIGFTALDFTDLRQTNYYYRLSDVDKNWIHTTTRQFAGYTDLKPGEYTFEVKADKGSGPSTVTSFAIVITPPWYGTFWFWALCAFTFLSILYLLVKRRINHIRKESEWRQRMTETEMMALRSQMNPHFIFNCINSIDAMIQSNDKYRATVYLNKFAKLIRNVLDSSKENKVPLSKDMETLQLYIDLELFRHQNKFMATIYADDELIQNDYKVPPLIIQPYVENAILHGLRQRNDHDGKLTVSVTKNNEHIVYVIEDNGVGRKAGSGDSGRNGQGYGMQMSSDRIRLFNDEDIASVQITDLASNGQPSGTRIRVQLKMQ